MQQQRGDMMVTELPVRLNILTLKWQMECFANLLDLFHMRVLKRTKRKHLEGRGSFL